MPSISGIFDTRAKQIIIQCGVACSGTVKNWQLKQEDASLHASFMMYNALIDTGATGTCISSKIVNDLNLIHHSMIATAKANGIIDTNIYDVDLTLHFGQQVIPVEKLRVTAVNLQTSNFDILIGMDIILRGHLSLSHDHHFTFSI